MEATTAGPAPFERRLYVGDTDAGERVTVDIEYRGGRLSLSGETRAPGATDISSGGQIVDAVSNVTEATATISPNDRQRLVDVWLRWHLNDMRAGCEHQRAAGWDKRPIDPEKPLDSYGLHFEGQRYASWNTLTWVRPDEVDGGLMGAPCEVCGYAYGSAWLREEVPADVLEFLQGLEEVEPDTGGDPFSSMTLSFTAPADSDQYRGVPGVAPRHAVRIVNADGWECFAYRCTLRYKGRSATLRYYAGVAHLEPPTVEDVFGALIRDAEVFESCDSSEVLAGAGGYCSEEDAPKLWREVTKQAAKLKRLVGEDEYELALRLG